VEDVLLHGWRAKAHLEARYKRSASRIVRAKCENGGSGEKHVGLQINAGEQATGLGARGPDRSC